MAGKTSFHLIEQKTGELRAIVKIVELDGGDIGLCDEENGQILFHWPRPGYVRQMEAYVREMAAREGFRLKMERPEPIEVEDIWGGAKKIPNPLGGNPAGEYEPEDVYPAEVW